MSEFLPYMHLERWNTEEVLGLQENTGDYIYIFPKLDGTNASIWYDSYARQLRFGSRRREISYFNDNRGFAAAMENKDSFSALFALLSHNPSFVLYGEWLCKHTIATYLDTAWNNFYLFDVYDRQEKRFLSYEEYKPLGENLERASYNIHLVPPLAIAKKLNIEDVKRAADENFYMMQEGQVGEGIVIKKYFFVNKYGRTTWAKYVRSEFTAKHIKEMGPRVINSVDSVEEKITSKYVSPYLVSKTLEKLRDKYDFEGNLPPKHTAELLQTVYYDLITEELWSIIKEYSSPTINFKHLKSMSYQKTKQIAGIN